MTELGRSFNSTGTWTALMDYAIKKGISLSTLRRHIKANKVTYKIENGRYLLWDEEALPPNSANSTSDQVALLQNHVNHLTHELKRANEEVVELKTLIALYEEKIPQQPLDN